MENEIIRKAEELLERCKTVVLSTLDGEGCPRPVVMATLHTEKLDIWVATSADSREARHLRANPRAGLCYYEGGDSVTLTGVGEVIDDDATKRAMWQEWMRKHFPEGPEDTDYCLIKFIARRGTFYIGEEFITADL